MYEVYVWVDSGASGYWKHVVTCKQRTQAVKTAHNQQSIGRSVLMADPKGRRYFDNEIVS